MRLFYFETCTDIESGSILGIQFTLGSYQDNTAEKFTMDPIGQMAGNCHGMKLLGPLEKIKAY